MKRFLSFLLCVLALFSLSGCNFLSANKNALQDSIDIPENGIVEENVFRQIMQSNAVVIFSGECGDYRYEWTVFGSDIKEPKTLNLALDINESDTGLCISFQSDEDFGFSPVLSIYLNEQWKSQNATVYKVSGEEKTALCSASVTGENESILNFAVTDTLCNLVVMPDELDADGEDGQKEDSKLDNSKNDAKDEASKTGETVKVKGSNGERKISDGNASGQDKYKTDPVPKGKPMPVEPEDTTVDKRVKHTCTFSIECSTIFNNLDALNPDKLDAVPSNGVILSARKVTFYEGESVYDVLQRVCRENGIQMEASFTPIYNSAYVEGIHNLYEFDCGSGSGWMYRVNGWYPNYGCSRYQLQQGETVEWRYTCNLGEDIGGGYAVGG